MASFIWNSPSASHRPGPGHGTADTLVRLATVPVGSHGGRRTSTSETTKRIRQHKGLAGNNRIRESRRAESRDTGSVGPRGPIRGGDAHAETQLRTSQMVREGGAADARLAHPTRRRPVRPEGRRQGRTQARQWLPRGQRAASGHLRLRADLI